MNDNFGLMEGAFFVSKNDILNWVKTNFSPGISKIEDASTGSLYCQIINEIYPKKVKMNKVNFKAKLEHESLANFKILQQGFMSCNISKNIEVEKLVKGKYQDNLEFLQWMKRYYDLNHGSKGAKLEGDTENYNSNNESNKKRELSKPKITVKKKESSNRDLEHQENKEEIHNEVNKKRELSKGRTMVKKRDSNVNNNNLNNNNDAESHSNVHTNATNNTHYKKKPEKQVISPSHKDNLKDNHKDNLKDTQKDNRDKKIKSVSALPNINQRKTLPTGVPSKNNTNVNLLKFENNNDVDVIAQKYLKCNEELQKFRNENAQLKDRLSRMNIANENINEENSKLAIELKKIEMIVKNDEKLDAKNVINQIKQMFGDNDLLKSIDIRKHTPKIMRPTTGKLSVNKNNNSKAEYLITKGSDVCEVENNDDIDMNNHDNNENDEGDENHMESKENFDHGNNYHENEEDKMAKYKNIDKMLHNNNANIDNNDNEGNDDEEGENFDNQANDIEKFKYLQKDIEYDSENEQDGELKEIQLDHNVNNSDDEMFKEQEKYLAVHNLDNN